MSSTFRRAGRLGLLASSAITLSLIAGVAFAQDSASQPDQPDVSDSAIKTIIVKTERSKAAATAPTKASVDATQPQSIISRPYIDLVVPETGDFTSVAQIAPSVSGTQGNGAGYGDAKLVLRGFQDGEYNITYDGIAYGDTNDPSHHSNTFFPASTIGALVVDRGPGMAGDLGQANFGGAIHMYSNKVTDDTSFTQKLSYGSFNSYQAVSIIQTGIIPDTGGAKALVNLQTRKTDGALSYFGLKSDNWEFKIEKPFGDNWKLTVLATHNQNFSYQPDNDGATLAQVAKYGKDFYMTNDPSSPTYYKYNRILKNTAFAYAKLEGDLGHGWSLDDTVYTYYYSNKTLSALDVTGQTPLGTYGYAAGVDPLTSTAKPTIANGDPTGMSGYDKFNYYDVNGNILRVNKQFSFGTLKMGGLAETSDTFRHRYDYQINPNDPYDTSIKDYREKNCVTAETIGTTNVKCNPDDRSVQYDERSWWTQYQLFADFIWTPTDNLTITPGLKNIQFTRNLAGKIKAKPTLSYISTPEAETFRKTLPFLTVNYKLRKNWSVYGQYAQGFLVPPLKDLYVNDVSQNTVEPEQTTNYQFGSVYNGSHVSLDGDVYQIDFKNKFACNNVYCYNQGAVTYKGIEGQAAYAFDFGLTVFANASMNSAKSDTSHLQIGQAPKSTLGFGGIYHSGPVKAALTFKQVGEQWADDGEPADYKIKAYNNVNLALSYDFGQRYTAKIQVDNLLDSRNITKITINGAPYDQYYYQAPTNAMLTLSARF
ncbi:TonB-dependent receptor [Asticcacaulis sp. EMRT-3]|uniref:TonB-dependent receptor n=1 Tax=Asticcacaulis sp. EMRT-3 TaxID=3040349 RepID=UPI0024AF9868|nr:TonB-dependent receptor [Asticcacaulis sp. EMRT-3]MDI7775779.1 TonB-dependent receptor [Asticcacaulis sp. EMRT-3]